jgi:hypothetical protein
VLPCTIGGLSKENTTDADLNKNKKPRCTGWFFVYAEKTETV